MELREAEAGEKADISSHSSESRCVPGGKGLATTYIVAPPVPPDDPGDSSSLEGGSLPSSETTCMHR